MTKYQLPSPTDLETGVLTDWAETILLLEELTFLSREVLKNRLQEVLFADETDLDAQVELLLREVGRRKRTAPLTYPFDFDEDLRGIRIDDALESAPYEFLLWLERSPAFRKQRRQGKTEKSFNSLVREALTGYLGKGAQALESAAITRIGTQSGLGRVLDRLADELNLFRLHKDPHVSRKDAGVDIVAWRPFQDNKPSFVVVLCQCTVQREWRAKTTDIRVHLWMQWIDFVRPPLTALAVPFAITGAFDRWDEIRSDVDIVLDRLRLCELLVAEECSGIPEIEEWCRAERSLLYH